MVTKTKIGITPILFKFYVFELIILFISRESIKIKEIKAINKSML